MLNKTGIPTKSQTLSRFPQENILIKPKAVIECFEDIPCNPCETACPFGAITIGPNINIQPQLDFDKCTGCTLCVSSCPGLAIFVVQIKGDQALFKIPYEFLPKPQKGEIWDGVNRKGEVICDALIEGVRETNKMDHTAIVTARVPKEFLHDFITVRERK
ncbi:MAG: 4Fe-4S binding protein [Acholeplasmatales bacterium]|jgi:Fe-S-cluster-containing hydrogenase component 2|nr:4Fe-4S binding protein [Acholeplasmataceae bacterium]MDY0115031.1 4Fe-4S binding protein [Acholeplasmatales bacterium]MCK9234378.1 4Fe-4S binding protein [Acholeplasmataceae bacterium]MCK9289385.1 4Fe-4S binding protein [Acholeplasmataceae bacterium]MCK9428097.1 4Fe-4S binding protein [Acholeplasmataceae bacterium]